MYVYTVHCAIHSYTCYATLSMHLTYIDYVGYV